MTCQLQLPSKLRHLQTEIKRDDLPKLHIEISNSPSAFSILAVSNFAPVLTLKRINTGATTIEDRFVVEK